MDYSGARGTLIHEKKLRSKISCQTPFKQDRLRKKNIFILEGFRDNSKPCLDSMDVIMAFNLGISLRNVQWQIKNYWLG